MAVQAQHSDIYSAECTLAQKEHHVYWISEDYQSGWEEAYLLCGQDIIQNNDMLLV